MLIEAFAADAHRAGAKGMHVVTSADARNVRFYEREGFRERARTSVNGRELVFLGRSLADDLHPAASRKALSPPRPSYSLRPNFLG